MQLTAFSYPERETHWPDVWACTGPRKSSKITAQCHTQGGPPGGAFRVAQKAGKVCTGQGGILRGDVKVRSWSYV